MGQKSFYVRASLESLEFAQRHDSVPGDFFIVQKADQNIYHI